MIIKYFKFFIPLVFSVIACQVLSETDNMSQDDFKQVLRCFKKISLPYKIEAGHGSEDLLDSTFFHQKILASPVKWHQIPAQSELSLEGLAPSHENVNCGALIFENEHFVVIDIQDTRIGYDRYLLVCTKEGDLIDGIPVAHLSKGKSGDESFDIQQFSEIDEHLNIKMTENIKHSFSGANNSDENLTKTATYQIQKNGKIKFIKIS